MKFELVSRLGAQMELFPVAGEDGIFKGNKTLPAWNTEQETS